MPHYSKWLNKDIEFLKQNYLTMPYDEIAQYLNRTAEAVKVRVHLLKLPLKHKRVPVHHHYFDVIDTQTKAYLLGFLAADGHVAPRSTSGYCIRFQLKQDDERIVCLLRDKIAPQKRLYYYENMALLDVTSEHMAKILMGKYGIKTHRKPNLVIPQLSERFLPLFILGYFDGDGWITRDRRGTTWTWALMAGKPLLSDILRHFTHHLNINLLPRTYDNWNEPDWMYRIAAYGSKATAIDSWLHQTDIGLRRKSIAWREQQTGKGSS